MIHNEQIWFPETFKTFYETKFNQNFTQTVKLPPRVAIIYFGSRPPTGSAYVDGITKLIGSVCQLAINMLVASSPASILKQLEWDALETDTQEYLRNGVAEIVQNACVNQTVFERLIANGLSTPTFSVNEDLTNWFITNDTIGQIARTIISLSGIDDYEWVSSGYLATVLSNGNIKIIGLADEDYMKKFNITMKTIKGDKHYGTR